MSAAGFFSLLMGAACLGLSVVDALLHESPFLTGFVLFAGVFATATGALTVRSS